MRSHRIRWIPLSFGLVLGAAAPAPAQLGARSGKEWIELLEKGSRAPELKIDEVIARIGLEPGDRIADLGAGTGTFTRPFARAVAPDGIAYGVEVDRDMVEHIQRRAREEGIGNLQGVLGKFDDPDLPTRDLDIAFFHDVIHHIEKREQYVRNLATYMKPAGRIVVIDMIHGHEDKPEMRISLDEVKRWLDAAGFRPLEEIPLFDKKFFVIFGRKP